MWAAWILVTELVCPFFIISPIRGLRIFGTLQVAFVYLILSLSGNYGATFPIVLLQLVACLDDQCLIAIHRYCCCMDWWCWTKPSSAQEGQNPNDILESVWDGTGDPGPRSAYEARIEDESDEEDEALTANGNPYDETNTVQPWAHEFAPPTYVAYAYVFCTWFSALLILCASLPAVRTLLTQNPWENHFDPWLLTTNSGYYLSPQLLRPQPVLEYTHDALRVEDFNAETLELHIDFQNSEDHRLFRQTTLARMQPIGESNDHVRPAVEAHDGPVWKTLEFLSLPGDPTRAPYMNLFYFWRLDHKIWERWTSNHIMRNGKADEIALKSLVQKLRTGVKWGTRASDPLVGLVRKILRGDPNVAALVASNYDDLFYPDGPSDRKRVPTAIRIRIDNYRFGESGDWWDVEPVIEPAIIGVSDYKEAATNTYAYSSWEYRETGIFVGILSAIFAGYWGPFKSGGTLIVCTIFYAAALIFLVDDYYGAPSTDQPWGQFVSHQRSFRDQMAMHREPALFQERPS